MAADGINEEVAAIINLYSLALQRTSCSKFTLTSHTPTIKTASKMLSENGVRVILHLGQALWSFVSLGFTLRGFGALGAPTIDDQVIIFMLSSSALLVSSEVLLAVSKS